FRWTESEGAVDLGVLPGTATTNATGVSADGSLVVGYGVPAATPDGSNAFHHQAFRWTAQEKIVPLGVLPGGASSAALAVSADGSTAVGRCNDPSIGIAIDQACIFHMNPCGTPTYVGPMSGGQIKSANPANQWVFDFDAATNEGLVLKNVVLGR